MYPASARSLTIPNALRSVIPTDTAISRSRAPGSRAMHSSTRAWLVRKPQVRMRGNYHITFPEYHCQLPQTTMTRHRRDRGPRDRLAKLGHVASVRAELRQCDPRRGSRAGRRPQESGCWVSPRVVLSLFSALILDHRGDVPDTYFKRERVDIVHAAQLLHEVEHVPHSVIRQPSHAHELARARLGETRHGPRLNPVKVAHDPPPIRAARHKYHGSRAHDGRGGSAGRADRAPVRAWSSGRRAPRSATFWWRSRRRRHRSRQG